MADDVLVMYAGRAVEYGTTCKEILTHPEMPYTWGLLSSVPDVTGDTNAKLIPIPGNPPSLLNPPSGCALPPALHPQGQGPRRPVPDRPCPSCCPGDRGGAHLKRCHLPTPRAIYADRDPPGDRAGPRRRARLEGAGLMATSPTPPTQSAGADVRHGRGDRPRRRPGRAGGTDGREADARRSTTSDVLPGEVVGPHPPHRRPRAGRRRRLVRGARGRLAGTRRRVRLRQVDHRPADHPAATTPTGGAIMFEGKRHRPGSASGSSSRCAARSR